VELSKIGKIESTHGLQGDLVISHLFTDKNEINNCNALMIELNTNSFIPYFIESIKSIQTNHFVCKIEDINTPEQAKEYIGLNVYASPYQKIKSAIKNNWNDMIGYALAENSNVIGTIESVINIKGTDYWQLTYNNNELLIPIIESWIIDVKANEIRINLPDGYLESFS
jgi:16S rRNA processing protein RimM